TFLHLTTPEPRPPAAAAPPAEAAAAHHIPDAPPRFAGSASPGAPPRSAGRAPARSLSPRASSCRRARTGSASPPDPDPPPPPPRTPAPPRPGSPLPPGAAPAAGLARRLDRVLQEVDQQLLQLVRITADPRIRSGHHPNAPRPVQRRHPLDQGRHADRRQRRR